MASEAATTNNNQQSRTAHFQLLKIATKIKLGELTKHERKLENHYTTLLANANSQPDKPKKLDVLYDGVKDLQVIQSNVHPGLEDIGGLVDFANSDPWSTQAVLEQRTQQIEREIQQRRSLWRYNKLFGALLMGSLEETTNETVKDEAATPVESTGNVEEAGNMDPLAALTKEETQQRLESYFFKPSGVIEDDVYKFLETEVFHRRETYSHSVAQKQQETLHSVRKTLRDFSENFLENNKVTESDVVCCVDALLRNKGSFSDDIVELLMDAKRNTQIQQELAHVLTIQVSNLKEFEWPLEGITVDIKRGMNGRFRCYLQEEVLTMLLFQYIGMKWAVQLKQSFRELLHSIVKQTYSSGSICQYRVQLMNKFMLAALPDSIESTGAAYDDSGFMKTGADEYGGNEVINKQDIIRLVCTEAHLQQALKDPEVGEQKSIVAVTTDLEFFGPSVSHEAVFACLRFLGVGDEMLAIFRKYMQIPLMFPGFDAPKTMVRGVSVSRMLSILLAEVVLFVMDYLVLSSSGIFLFRTHDDICFYNEDEAKVVRAWKEMNRYSKTVGLKFNDEKSGSTRLMSPALPSTPGYKAQCIPVSLPSSPIRWGLLELQSDGSVCIQQEKVDAFTVEMIDRLSAASSPLSWINVYNKYMAFFLRNFGSVSPIFGMTHVDEMLKTLQQIHRSVFPQSNGDALVYLKEQILRHHSALMKDEGTASIPAAWVHWPMDLGGLGMFNPFLLIWSLKKPMYNYLERYHTREDQVWPKEQRDWDWRMPFTTICRQLRKDYDSFAEKVEQEGVRSVKDYDQTKLYGYLKSSSVTDRERQFGRVSHEIDETYTMRTFLEYLHIVPFIEELALKHEFEELVSEVPACNPPGPSFTAWIATEQVFSSGGINGTYWAWVAYIYSTQLTEEFGTVSFFTRELLPAQLVSTIKKQCVSW